MIECKPEITPDEIGLRETSLKTIKNAPHEDALSWRLDYTYKQWNVPIRQ